MPCRGPSIEEIKGMEAQQKAQQEIDKVTQYLCYVIGYIKEHDVNLISGMDERVIDWADNHHKRDTERVHFEMVTYVSSNYHDVEILSDDYEKLVNHFTQRAKDVHPVSPFHVQWFRSLAADIVDVHNQCIKQRIEKLAKKENLKLSALKKLSEEEKRALGLS